ncbi:MAG: type II toxin-antitoxin system VapB family antitoxin [Myxococcota bacterium]
MRTSIEIPDSLFERARRLARRRGTSFKSLVEEGLRRLLAEDAGRKFKLRDESFRGDGLVGGGDRLDWERVRDEIYAGRGS